MRELTITLCLTLLFICSVRQTFAQAPTDPNDCFENSMHCWPKTYLVSGTVACGNYSDQVNDNFSNLNKWYTAMDNPATSGSSRINNECEEQLYMDANVTVANNKCTLTGQYEPNGVTWTSPGSSGKYYVREFSSGAISTKNSYHFGKYECTVADMPGKGWWPAFWLWHHEEIDIMFIQVMDVKNQV